MPDLSFNCASTALRLRFDCVLEESGARISFWLCFPLCTVTLQSAVRFCNRSKKQRESAHSLCSSVPHRAESPSRSTIVHPDCTPLPIGTLSRSGSSCRKRTEQRRRLSTAPPSASAIHGILIVGGNGVARECLVRSRLLHALHPGHRRASGADLRRFRCDCAARGPAAAFGAECRANRSGG